MAKKYRISLIIVVIYFCHILPSEERSMTAKSNKEYTRFMNSTCSEETTIQKPDVSKYDRSNKTALVVSSRAVKNDPWQGYYDFLINEGSYKFWAVFQVATALVLIYSAAAAIYYAKYNFIQPEYEYPDYFFGRSDSESSYSSSIWNSDNAQLFQRIIDAITSKKYS